MISCSNKKNYDHTLIFFPFAGGNGESYIPWFKHFLPNISCRYALLKGRGKYFHKNAFNTINELIDDIIPEVYKVCDKPFSFFGHSMGALIAFEMSRTLHKEFNIIPDNLFISGFRPPQLTHNRRFLHTMSKKELLEEIRKMGGLKLIEPINIDQLEPFFPTLYSDFKLCELYKYKHNQPLSCKISVLWGDTDDCIQSEQISLWQKESCFPIDFRKFSGGHFYIWENTIEIALFINNKIKESLL
ncbi:thioesterase II family protein [Wolbachia endosymbiont (group A) of Myopa testacea]|uniref:thioesterase II family protein n=1 Tax=Wolbachia endosymbiont (group A) of Myopa testacea TaxID=3066148 RepID=UPI0031330CCD